MSQARHEAEDLFGGEEGSLVADKNLLHKLNELSSVEEGYDAKEELVGRKKRDQRTFSTALDTSRSSSSSSVAPISGSAMASAGPAPRLVQRPIHSLDEYELESRFLRASNETDITAFMQPKDVPLQDRLKGLPGNLQLSPQMAGKYFGFKARTRFMERTQFIRRQRMITNSNPAAPVDKLYYNNEDPEPHDMLPFSAPARKGVQSLHGSASSSANSILSRTSTARSGSSRRALTSSNTAINSGISGGSPMRLEPLGPLQTVQLAKPPTVPCLAVEADAEGGLGDDVLDDITFDGSDYSERDDKDSLDSDGHDDDDDMEGVEDDGIDDDLTLTSKMIEEGAELAQATSPRSNYIAGCIKEGLNPRAGLLVRKNLSKKLELQHMGFGDEYGKLLAEAIQDLPFLEAINIANNRLTDEGLAPILRAVVKLPVLLEVDMSQNKIDSEAANAMGEYLESETCTLERLMLRDADVDDFEGDRFIQALKTNRTVKEIDLSNNKLGIAENRKTVEPDITTSGEALASLLETPGCYLQTLKLSWNRIRLNGGVALCSSLARNSSLTYLDLSCNALGSIGGCALGDALINNRTLHTLLVATNGIDSAACFTISVGVLENENLQYLNLDGNGIGEQGARSLMMIPKIVGSRVKISAQKCNVTLKDSACTFDFYHVLRSYKLDLSDHFQRAQALLLLHMISAHHSYVISQFDLELLLPNGKPSGKREQLSLVPFLDGSKVKFFDDKQKAVEASLRNVLDACSDVNKSIEFYKAIDVDGSGELEIDEFSKLLASMGIFLDEVRLIDCFNTYDTDQGGTLGVAEFLVFLKKTRVNTELRLRDLTTTPAYRLEGQQQKRYLPPTQGFLHINVVDGFNRKAIFKTMTSVDRDNIAMLAECTGDPSKMTNYSVGGIQMRCDEAFSLFESMMKDGRGKVAVLSSLLPQLSSTLDARMLVSKCLNQNKTEMFQLRKALGSAIRPILGTINGYYVLDMSKDFDRVCLVRLIEISRTKESTRSSSSKLPMGRVADSSQHGTMNSAFRNGYFNGKPCDISPEFATPLPKYGVVSFDYSGADTAEYDDVIAADGRIITTLMQCYLLKEREETEALLKLKRLKAYSHLTNGGDARTIYECDWERAKAIGDTQHTFYSSMDQRLAAHMDSAPLEEVKVDYTNAAAGQTPDAIVGLIRRDIDFSTEASCYSPGSVSSSQVDILEKSDDESDGAEDEGEAAEASVASSDEYQRKLRDLLAAENVSTKSKAAKMYELLDETFSKLWIYSRHLALICEVFAPLGLELKTEVFGTYRVDLVVSLFERLVDPYNFELVLRVLEPAEVGCIYCRLGWLSLYNPMKPEGGYSLNMAVFEERIVAKTLVVLATDEPGDNLSKALFSWDRFGDPIPGWEMTVSWCKEEGMPAKGVLSVVYYSGEGRCLKGCAPNVHLRRALLQLTKLVETEILTDEERFERSRQIFTRSEIDQVSMGQKYANDNIAIWTSYLVPDLKSRKKQNTN